MANEHQDDLSMILRAAHDEWELGRPLGMWSALKRSGHSEHYIVARTAPELAEKIARAEGSS